MLGDTAANAYDQMMAVLTATTSIAEAVPALNTMLNANGGVVSIVSIALAGLAALGSGFSEYFQKLREENIEWIKAGADSVPSNFSYSDQVDDVIEMRGNLRKGHLPQDISLEDAKGYNDALTKNDKGGGLTEEQLGAAAEYDYQMYLGEIDRVIEEAKAREQAAWDVGEAPALGIA